MDRSQVISLVLLLAVVFALALDGTRAYSDAYADDDELMGPWDISPAQEAAPEPPVQRPDWDPAWRYERRLA